MNYTQFQLFLLRCLCLLIGLAAISKFVICIMCLYADAFKFDVQFTSGAFFSAITVISIIGIWNYKKWGAYTYFINFIISLFCYFTFVFQISISDIASKNFLPVLLTIIWQPALIFIMLKLCWGKFNEVSVALDE